VCWRCVASDGSDALPAAGGRPTNDDVIGGDRKKKSRTVFSRRQVAELETTFGERRYVSSVERRRLAATLQLSETQVKVWFQNRRNKWKRQSDVATVTTPAAHCLASTTTEHPAWATHSLASSPAAEHSAWNGGAAIMSPRSRDAVSLISTFADSSRDHCRYLPLPVTVSTRCNLLPIVCSVVSFPGQYSSRLTDLQSDVVMLNT